RRQRNRSKETELAPQQRLLVRNELAGKTQPAQPCDNATQERLSAASEIEARKRRALNESSRSNSLCFDGNRPGNHTLRTKARPQHRDVVDAVQQGNHTAR